MSVVSEREKKKRLRKGIQKETHVMANESLSFFFLKEAKIKERNSFFFKLKRKINESLLCHKLNSLATNFSKISLYTGGFEFDSNWLFIGGFGRKQQKKKTPINLNGRHATSFSNLLFRYLGVLHFPKLSKKKNRKNVAVEFDSLEKDTVKLPFPPGLLTFF